jgi:Flp pilus assembly protein TadD
VSEAPAWWGGRRGVLALVAFGLAVYGRTLAHGFVYDDWLHVAAEPIPESLAQLARVFAEPMSPLVPYYRPIARVLTAAQLALHGAAPLPFHALNLALGVACALALRAVLATRALGATPLVATLAAALFLAHPLAAECIAPIASGRETLLPTLFTLLAVASYLRATALGRALAVACFALGLLSKEQAIATPLVLALADALRIAPDAPRGARAWAARYAPHAAVIAAYAAARSAAVPAALAPGLALFAAPAGPVLSLLYDVQTTFAPLAHLAYEPPLDVWWSPPRLALAVAAALALLAAALRVDRRRALWWLAWIGLALAPTANVLSQETRFAERWGFPALAGWIGLAVLALAPGRERGALRGARALAIGLALAACATLTQARLPAYADDDAFLAQWRATNPASAQAWISTGEALERRGELDAAIAAYRHVLALNPETALAHASLAIALAEQGDLEQAQRHAERAVALDPRDAESWSNLGGIRAQRGDDRAAIDDYERALEMRPDLASAHNNLALALRRRGDIQGAKHHLASALSTRPQFAEAHANLGDLLAAQGDTQAARRHLERALQLDPTLTPARQALRRLRGTAPAP